MSRVDLATAERQLLDAAYLWAQLSSRDELSPSQSMERWEAQDALLDAGLRWYHAHEEEQ